ncbi:hypothetical protein F4804DRAFT_24775 [Jackrogersella minutella]|nr:hypothetical protein F4804DRAFT_24775 [Jackrogersella minutella]
MTSTKPFTFLGLATLALQVNGFTLTGYKGNDCQGDVQQTLQITEYGATCSTFHDKVESVKVEGSTGDEPWIFFNNWCSTDSQVGSFTGNGCMTMGKTKIKAVTNILPEGGSKKRTPAGTVQTWKNTDCSGNPTNSLQFPGENLPLSLNDVSSIKVTDVPENDIAFACSDSNCHVDNQVATLENGACNNVKGKSVSSAMAIGVVTPPKRRDAPSQRRNTRSLILEARERDMPKRDNDITCNASKGPGYKDALKVGDDWQGSNGMGCCCVLPGGPDSKTSGSAKASIGAGIRCPASPSGTPPPPTQCPMNCNSMRSWVYAIATKCKTSDGKTGGSVDLGNDQTITVSHS